jgi:hypothetical protein
MTHASIRSKGPRGPRGPVAAHPVTSAVIAVLVIASIFFVLWVPLYPRAAPRVGDLPFCYFCLIVYMPALAIVLGVVMLLQNRLRPPGGQDDGPAAGGGPSEVAR